MINTVKCDKYTAVYNNNVIASVRDNATGRYVKIAVYAAYIAAQKEKSVLNVMVNVVSNAISNVKKHFPLIIMMLVYIAIFAALCPLVVTPVGYFEALLLTFVLGTAATIPIGIGFGMD